MNPHHLTARGDHAGLCDWNLTTNRVHCSPDARAGARAPASRETASGGDRGRPSTHPARHSACIVEGSGLPVLTVRPTVTSRASGAIARYFTSMHREYVLTV